MENSAEFHSKTKIWATIWSRNPTPGQICAEKLVQKDTCSPVFTATLLNNSQNMEAT